MFDVSSRQHPFSLLYSLSAAVSDMLVSGGYQIHRHPTSLSVGAISQPTRLEILLPACPTFPLSLTPTVFRVQSSLSAPSRAVVVDGQFVRVNQSTVWTNRGFRAFFLEYISSGVVCEARSSGPVRHVIGYNVDESVPF